MGDWIRLRQACHCEGATATMPGMMRTVEPTHDGAAFRFTFTMHPMTCDECGTPWEQPTDEEGSDG